MNERPKARDHWGALEDSCANAKGFLRVPAGTSPGFRARREIGERFHAIAAMEI